MFYQLCFILILGFTTAWAVPNISKTPAEQIFDTWLEAFNTGDPALMEAYYRKYEPSQSAENQMQFRKMTGGFELIKIFDNEPLHIEFLVKERYSETVAAGSMDVKKGDPAVVTSFSLNAIPTHASISDLNFKINAATRNRVINNTIASLNEFYVTPETAKKMEDAIQARQKKGEYDSINSGLTFAKILTENLQEVSHDKHLRVDFTPARLPEKLLDPDDVANDAQYRQNMEKINCGFSKMELLPGNIGYLKFNMFANPEVCGATAIAAMNFFSNVDALIIDLRENGGGDPAMIALISSYLFSKSTHLNDLWERKANTVKQYWTLPYVPGQRLADQPVYVLTSTTTFSGAEEFSYNLKNLKRVTIVGEVTGGGAHPVSGHRIDDHFMIGVPYAKAINPISKTNWEGTGVEPDVKVPATEALTTAQKLAAQKLESK
jgi:retinol-binding protein 3